MAHRSTRTAALTLPLTAVLLLAACGGDSDDTASGDGASGETAAASDSAAASDTAAGAGDTEAFCSTMLEFDAVPPPSGDGDAPPAAADVTAYGEQVQPLLQTIADSAPESAGDAAAGLVDASGTLVQGDPAPFDDPAVMEQLGTVEQAVADECGFTEIALTGVDFSFEGAPDSSPAGPTSIVLTNGSTEGRPHVVLVMRSPDGAPVGVDAFLADPDAAFASMQVVGAASAMAGTTGGVTLDLPAGDYLLVCPVGSQTPHYAMGMITAMTVV